MPSENPVADATGSRIEPEKKQFKIPGKKRFKIPLAPFLLLLPWLIGLAVFRAYPIARSFWLSLTHFHIMDDYPTFAGLDNYVRMFTNDPLFFASVAATLRFVFIGTPIVLIAAFFVAYVLNFKLKGVNLFRTAYYIPSILGGNVAVAILWRQMFRNDGLINAALGIFGIDPIFWLRTETFAPIVLVVLSAWQFGSTMLIFLAGLQNVSPTLYEAAEMDGAKKYQQLFRITIPVISPILFFNTINVMLRHFQEFNAAFLITEGGPLNATLFMNLYIYQRSFAGFEFGYGSALTWVLLLGIGLVTLVLWLTSKFWVHYSD